MLPVGKLPADLLARLLDKGSIRDPEVLLGPGIGIDCTIIDNGETVLVLKSDPITFTIQDIGWYAVQVNANDIATTGAIPRWFLATLLLPESGTTPELVEDIFDQIWTGCQDIGACLVGGHTEITYGLDRPILVGTMIGEVDRGKLVTPRGAQPGDRLLLTKGVPIEATAILSREFGDRLCRDTRVKPSTEVKRLNKYHGDELSGETGIKAENNITKQSFQTTEYLSKTELKRVQDFVYQPGISVLREARIACRVGRVHAMHDPTEGGIYTALWEMSQACGLSFQVNITSVPVPELSARICRILGVDPLAAIASGSLLLAVAEDEAPMICDAIQEAGIVCTDIGVVTCDPGAAVVWYYAKEGDLRPLPRPSRDAIASLFETNKK
jgi:hydrogenase maturation factor